MPDKKVIMDEVAKTLASFDNDPVLKDNPFLYTRIINERENRIMGRKIFQLGGVSPYKVLLLIIILINLFTVAFNLEWNKKEDLQKKLVYELKSDFGIDQTQNNF